MSYTGNYTVSLSGTWFSTDALRGGLYTLSAKR